MNSFEFIFFIKCVKLKLEKLLREVFSWFWFAKPYWLATFDARFLLAV